MGKLLIESETASHSAASVKEPTERVRQGCYRLPPAKKDEYLVLIRERVSFSVRSKDVTGIGDLDQLVISGRKEEVVSGAGEFNDLSLNLVDVGWALAQRDYPEVNAPG